MSLLVILSRTYRCQARVGGGGWGGGSGNPQEFDCHVYPQEGVSNGLYEHL